MTLLAAGSEIVPQPEGLLLVTRSLNLAVLLLAVVVIGRRLRQRSTPAASWAMAMFSVLALVVLSAFFPVLDDGSLLRHGYTVVLVSVLLLFPYLLVRFAYSLGAVGKRVHQGAVVLTVVILVATILAPTFPQPGEARSGAFTAYVFLLVAIWTAESVAAAIGLWRAGHGQPSVVRHRMRSLSIGAVVVSLSLVAGSGSGQPSEASQVVTSVVGVLGIGLLVLAFVVPPWLAAAWREPDLIRLGVAERTLTSAVTPEQVAVAIVPALVQLFGARGAALIDRRGATIDAEGLSAVTLSSVAVELNAETSEEPVIALSDGGFACRLQEGWLFVQAGSFAPVFGSAELLLLDRVASFADLSLQRCLLFAEEAASRSAAEAAGTELQTLIYSVSHDLRNPIISVLGYLDVLQQEHVGELQGDGPHYLERIAVNAVYMQNLIQDLLELSRIGRSEPAPQAVAMGPLAASVTQEVQLMHPGCEITVEGSFPVLWMSELRARQLLINLIDNAVKHAQGEALVKVSAVSLSTGEASLLISDNGPGIPPHLRDKAFEVFERLDAARTDVPGTGMGLPICKRILESLGGTIALEGPSAGSPSGTTARLTFPAPVVQAWTSDTKTAEKESA